MQAGAANSIADGARCPAAAYNEGGSRLDCKLQIDDCKLEDVANAAICNPQFAICKESSSLSARMVSMSSGGDGSMGEAAKKRLAGECYRKGNEALEKGNWDYALNMFSTCAAMQPDNVMFRQLARGAAYKKYDNNKSGAGTLAKGKLISIRGKVKKARANKDWDEMDKQAEEGLKVNPWDAQLNADLGEACRERGAEFLDVAKFAYSCARSADPQNKGLNRALAEVLEERSEFTEAHKVWEHICKIDPNDGEARSKATGALFKETTAHGGYEGAENTRDVAVQRSKLGPKAGETDAPGMSVEKDLQHAIRKEPDKVEHYLKLAHHYRQNKKLDEAHETLQKALEVSGGDPNIQEQIEDVQLDQMRHNLLLAKEHFSANKDDASAKGQYRELDKELLKRELETYRKRVDRYPQDMNLKVALAERLMRIKKWPQAIPLLQKASQHTRLKGTAHFLLARCFFHDNKLKLARGQLERAIPELNYEADAQAFKEAHYLMGRICEELGDAATAEKHYGEVLVVDYDYKDSRERLEQLQAGDGPAGGSD